MAGDPQTTEVRGENVYHVERIVHFSEPTFYFDIGSPYAYLAAERLPALLPDARWPPVLLGGLFKLTGRSSWALGDYRRRQAGMAEIEQRTRGYGLPPMRWPDPWPSDYLYLMRACTSAFALGRGREFAVHAFRAMFQRGIDLGRRANVDALAHGFDLRPEDAKQQLLEATHAAFARGVFGVPTLAIGGELFWGDDRLEAALS
jgi:2-hydroxychromene-2-carboxylate isomerase